MTPRYAGAPSDIDCETTTRRDDEAGSQVNGVAVDLLTIGPGEEFLQETLDPAPGTFLHAQPLVYLKLKSPRLQDHADIVELVKASLDVEACRRYLRANAPDLLPRFDELVTRAQSE